MRPGPAGLLLATGLAAVLGVGAGLVSESLHSPSLARPAPSGAASPPAPTASPTRATVPRRTPVAGPGLPDGDGRLVSLRHDGRRRDYLLLPPLDGGAGAAPLVVVLHQDVASPRSVASGLGLDVLRRDGFALAYPGGYGGSWNAGGCCGLAQEHRTDDVGFVQQVVRDAVARGVADPARTALLGYSGGGMLLYRMLCERALDVHTAIEVNGSLEVDCPPGVRLPRMLSVHGARDGSVGFTRPIAVTHLGMSPRPVTETLATVVDRAGCATRTPVPGKVVDVVRWDGCEGGGTLEAQIVRRAGHRWEDVGGAARARAFLQPLRRR